MKPAFKLFSRSVAIGGHGRKSGFHHSHLCNRSGQIVVQVKGTGAKIGSMSYGLVTGEINCLCDVGFSGHLPDVNFVADSMRFAPRSSTIDTSAKFVYEFPKNTVSAIRFSPKQAMATQLQPRERQ